MFARATVTAGARNTKTMQTAEAPLIIPASAPLITGKRAVVYVAVPDRDRPTFEGRDVVLGARAGDYYIVASGLSEGEMVVVNGAFKIDSELQIRAKPSMMSPEGGIPMTHNHGAPATSAKPTKSSPPEKHERITGLPHGFTGELTPVYDAYFDLHAALADDKQPAARAAVGELHQRIAAIDAGSLGEPAEDAWQRVSTRLADATALKSDDGDWDELRTGFEDIAAAMIDLDYYFGHPDTGAYFVTFCPMAFNNRGAYWLQNTKAITNPYFGHKMLKCGKITDEIQPIHEH
jgi:Cu(I)/Ag(I) efflux system membrane fusion protein